MSADALPVRSPSGVTMRASVPAQLRFLVVVRDTVRIAMDGYGADAACETDIGLAVDELASLLILTAGSAGALGVAITHDLAEVHIELTLAMPASAPTEGGEPVVDELSRRLLEATTDAHTLGRTGPELIGRCRRRLRG